jgi:hypothetical protein
MTDAPDCPRVPVSWGELLDKITILQIKCDRIGRARARANVAKELALLQSIAGQRLRDATVMPLLGLLRTVNEDLWGIEDRIREHEAARDFGHAFVQLARSVYQKNDLRAAIKRQINDLLGSALVEEKSYAGLTSIMPRQARSTTAPVSRLG